MIGYRLSAARPAVIVCKYGTYEGSSSGGDLEAVCFARRLG
jgi:hypothetical protein